MSRSDRKDEFDVIVIGSGATGQSVAFAAREDGRSVAVVEERTLGGTCPNRGCDAKKVYVNAAEAFEATVRLAGKGIRTTDLSIRWDELLRTKRSFVDPIHDGTAERLREEGIEVVLGRARFVEPHALDVGGRRLTAERIVVATGSRPAPLEFPGADRMIDSDAFLERESLPRRVCFVGGGFVSFEFAHVAARAGCDVTILHRDDRPLGGFDEHVVDALVEATRSIGIEVRLGHEVRAVEASGGGERVTATCGSETVRLDADLVVHGAGRAPNVESLALEVLGIAPTERGLPVDDRARCVGAPHVLAGGDVADAGHPKLLRVAAYHASVISSVLRGEEDGPTLKDVRPVGVVFTAPRLAGIGLTERAARERGFSVRVRTEPEKTWKLLRESNARAFAFKTIVDDETDRVLGAFVLAPGAEALIDLIALAIDADLPADALKRPLYGYPALGGHVGAMIP